jgi:hypothetical protein
LTGGATGTRKKASATQYMIQYLDTRTGKWEPWDIGATDDIVTYASEAEATSAMDAVFAEEKALGRNLLREENRIVPCQFVIEISHDGQGFKKIDEFDEDIYPDFSKLDKPFANKEEALMAINDYGSRYDNFDFRVVPQAVV